MCVDASLSGMAGASQRMAFFRLLNEVSEKKARSLKRRLRKFLRSLLRNSSRNLLCFACEVEKSSPNFPRFLPSDISKFKPEWLIKPRLAILLLRLALVARLPPEGSLSSDTLP